MGIWAGIKHALNSTLGTADFKPLNEIFTDNITVVASDSVLKVLSSTSTYLSTDDWSAGYFNAQRKGTVRIKALLQLLTVSDSVAIRIENTSGVIIGKVTKDITESCEYELCCDVNVSKGERYYVYLTVADWGYSAGSECLSVKVCGNSVYGTLIS